MVESTFEKCLLNNTLLDAINDQEQELPEGSDSQMLYEQGEKVPEETTVKVSCVDSVANSPSSNLFPSPY